MHLKRMAVSLEWALRGDCRKSLFNCQQEILILWLRRIIGSKNGDEHLWMVWEDPQGRSF